MESIPIVPQPINVPATSKESAVDKGNSPCAASHQGTTMEVTKTSITEASLPMTPVTNCSITETSNKILDIILDYALSKFNGTKDRLEAGRPKFLSVLDKFVSAGTRVEMCLPAFPFKSANKVYKVFGILPDKAEEIALDRLNTMCMRIGEVYQPGAKYTIISDGLVYNGSSSPNRVISIIPSCWLICIDRLVMHIGSRYLGLRRGSTGNGCQEGVHSYWLLQNSRLC